MKGQLVGTGPKLVAGVLFIMIFIVILFMALQNPTTGAMEQAQNLIGEAADKATSSFSAIGDSDDSDGQGSSFLGDRRTRAGLPPIGG